MRLPVSKTWRRLCVAFIIAVTTAIIWDQFNMQQHANPMPPRSISTKNQQRQSQSRPVDLTITLPKQVWHQGNRANLDSLMNQTIFSAYIPTSEDLATKFLIDDISWLQGMTLNLFVAHLINQMRNQLGTPSLLVSQSAFEIATNIATEYQQDGWDFNKQNDVDNVAINKAMAEYGFLTHSNQNLYEHLIVVNQVHSPYPVDSLAFAKYQLWQALQTMFMPNNVEAQNHLESLLGLTPAQQALKPTFLGVAFDHFGVMHFEILPTSLITQPGNKIFHTMEFGNY